MSSNSSNSSNSSSSSSSKDFKAKVNDDYTQIKLRRETFIGRAGNSDEKMYLYDYTSDTLSYEKVRLNFTALKIFDEILVNAIDNLSRSIPSNRLTEIKVSFIKVDSMPAIRVYNDGPSIRIAKYEAEPRRSDETDVQYQRRFEIESKQLDKYYPEVLFTVLKSSTNYNKEDEKTRTTGGMNGLGAKLTSIFSKYFIIDVVNSGLSYHQVVSNNCENISKPKISKTSDKSSVCITFVPDWPLVDPSGEFTSIDSTLREIIAKRVFDYSHLPVNLYINDTLLPHLTYEEFARRHISIHNPSARIYESICTGKFKQWKIAFAFSPTKNDSVSYVNNVVTYKGGQHVELIRKQITSEIKSHLKKTTNAKSINTKLSFVIYSIIPGIAFESQAKTAISNDKISVPTLSSDLISNFIRDNSILEFFETGKVKSTNTKAIRKRITTISKLRDAEEAGTPYEKRKHICTLFICEGDSAQTLCDRGIKILGERYYGSYALRGKVLNTLKASSEKYVNNKELTELKSIIGLVEGKKYINDKDLKSLRYQRIVCCKDADYDGSAIMGLVINFFYQYFRELMERNDFFFEFITPVINVYEKPYVPKSSIFIKAYYNLNVFKKDCELGTINPSKYYCKYIKGLGGNTDKDIEIYFSEFEKHLIHINCTDKETEDHIDLAYSKKTGITDLRKDWVASVNDDSYLPRDAGEISFNDFCDIDLALAGFDTCERSIPSVIDGLKPSQRKVLYTFFNMSKNAASTSTKVFQITGKVADFASYHHGDASLNGTITKMGQDFIGSNNIPLLEKDGQFGSRNKLGDDASAPRYIAAYLSPVARLIFPSVDDILLKRRIEDNEEVEPMFYVPIIPLLLVNGADGIGTGWRSQIPMFNPIELIEKVRNAIEKYPKIPSLGLDPWCRHWTGVVVEYKKEWMYIGKVVKDGDEMDKDKEGKDKKNRENNDLSDSSDGESDKNDRNEETVYRILDIPVYMSIDELRANMNTAIDEGILKDYTNLSSKSNKSNKTSKSNKSSRSSRSRVKQAKSSLFSSYDINDTNKDEDPDAFEFKLTFNPGKVEDVEDVLDILKLRTTISKNTLVAFNNKNSPIKYNSTTYMFAAWFTERRKTYINRKKHILSTMNEELKYMRNKLRFASNVDSYDLKHKNEDELERLLEDEGYNRKSDKYDYLRNMPIDCSAAFKIVKMKEEIKKKEEEIENYEKKTIEEIWNSELDVLEKYIKENY